METPKSASLDFWTEEQTEMSQIRNRPLIERVQEQQPVINGETREVCNNHVMKNRP